MQWLIDIIKELIHGQLGYFDRGDPGAYDFTLLDFIRNNTWQDLDLSTIVPANAQAVVILVNIRSDFVNRAMRFRRNGNTDEFSGAAVFTQVGAVRKGAVFPLACDENRIIEYKVQDATFNLINLSVCGWWLR